MSQILSQPAAMELDVQRQLRTEVEKEINRRRLSKTKLAKKLDLLPSGAQALMEREVWSIETAIRVAQCLNIKMHFELNPQR
jgi:plasmid maintenance system antidote protein VapI